MKIRSFFIFIILFIISSLAILSISTIDSELATLKSNIREQNNIQYLELLLIASERIYDEYQKTEIAELYQNQGPIDFHPTNQAIQELIQFAQQQPEEEGFPWDKYTALEFKLLSEDIRKKNSVISNNYAFNRLESTIEYRIIQLQNHAGEFTVYIEGVRLTSRLYALFTDLIDQLINVSQQKKPDEYAWINAIKLLGTIDEAENRLATLQKTYLKRTRDYQEIDALLNKIFNYDIISINNLVYTNFDNDGKNTIDLKTIDQSYQQAKFHITTLNHLLLQQAIEISENQVYLSKIKIYSMICFLIIFFLFCILPISIMIFKLHGAFSLVQKAITQLSNNDLNINFNESESRFSFELEAIIKSLIKLKNIQIEKNRLENKNQELINQLKLNSTTDYLTTISNRRAFLEAIEHSPAGFFNHSTLAIIDIDNFKQINDKYGHTGGDEVLVKFAQLLKQFFRKDDLFCRYGGEEFAVLLHNCDHLLAQTILERLCKKVRYLAIELSSGTKVFFTISVGVAELHHKSAINQSINKADKALYLSKSTGKDRVTVYEMQPLPLNKD